MSEKLVLLTNTRNEFQKLSNEREELLKKGNLDDTEFKRLEELNEKCDESLAKVEVAKKAIDSSNANAAFETNANPNLSMVVNGMTRNADDTTTIDLQTKAVLEQGGQGLISWKQFQKLNTPEYKDAFEAMVRFSYATKGQFHSKLDAIQTKNLEEGLDPQGGYLIPPQYIMRLISRMPAPARVQSKVQVFNTGKDKIILPRLNYTPGSDETYTTPFRVTWTGENPSSSTQARVSDTDLFGQMTIDVYTAMMSGVLTKDMVEDTDFPILQWVADKFGETIMLLRDEMIVSGTGVNQPYGLVTNPGGTGQPVTVLSGVANSISADNIRQLPFELAEQYVNDNACWVFNRKNTGKFIMGLKDSQNRYMWAKGSMDDKLANRGPDNLDGYDICYSTFMPNIGDGLYPILFGDLMAYYLVNRIGLAITFYYDSAFDLLNQIGIGGRVRFGGKTAEPWKLRLLKSDDA